MGNGTGLTVSWVDLVSYRELPINTGKTVRYGNIEAALFRLTDGTVKAIENRCPHKNGVLAEGIVCGESVFCPLHDRQINLTSGLMQKPDIGCVKTFQVKVEAERVWIGFPDDDI